MLLTKLDHLIFQDQILKYYFICVQACKDAYFCNAKKTENAIYNKQ